MSWFSLSIQAKQSWDSHSTLEKVLSGGFLGDLIVNNVIKPCPVYYNARNAVAEAAASRFAPKTEKIKSIVSTHILAQVLNKTQIARLGVILKTKVSQLTCQDLLSFSSLGLNVLNDAAKNCFYGICQKDNSLPKKTSAPQRTKELLTYLYKNFSPRRAFELVTMLKDRKCTDFTHSILAATLQPVCEKAVQSSLKPIIKTGLSNAVDLGVKISVSAIVQAIFYKPVVSALFKQMQITNYEVQFSTLLLSSAAYHASRVAGSILYKKFIGHRPDADKQELQQLVTKLAKDPIKQALINNPLFKYLEKELDNNATNTFANKIIEELVNFYWTDLKMKKFLGIPLVL